MPTDAERLAEVQHNLNFVYTGLPNFVLVAELGASQNGDGREADADREPHEPCAA